LQKKHQQLIDFLYNNNGRDVTSTILSEVLGVTDRTIRNYIKTINESSNIEIVSSSKGYAIKSDNDELIHERLSPNKKETEDAILDFEIIQYLMNKDEYISYDEIADKFFFSPQTIRRRIQNLTIDIKELNIQVSINTQVFKGIKLEGTEIQKRILLERYFTIIPIKKELFQRFVINSFYTWVNKDVINNIFEMVDTINIDYSLNLEFQMYKKITVQLIIMVHQIQCNRIVSINDTILTDLSNFVEYNVGKAFREKLSKDIDISNEEAIYFVNYLMSLQLDLDETQIENKNPTIIKNIENILYQIECDYHVPVISEEKFKNNIINHIYRMINPVSYNLFIYNPFVKETKSEYFFSFSIASNIALQIEKKFQVIIQDSEIAYLAYHVQVILDSLEKKKIKTVILYSRNYERTKLLASKISTYFDELEICKIEKCTTKYTFDYAYFYIGINLTSIPKTKANIITINHGFDSSDIKKIRFSLEAQQSIVEASAIDWIDESSIETAIQKLLTLNNMTQFYDLIMKREQISYTSIGNLVAIPHPYFEKNEYKESILIGLNKSKIKWGNEMVQLIIIYIPSSDIERNEYVFSEFFQKTKSIESVKKLMLAKTKEEFISTWNKY